MSDQTCCDCVFLIEGYCGYHQKEIGIIEPVCDDFEQMPKPKKTVFHQITASPDVLAETLVIPDEDNNGWYSVIITIKYGQYFMWFSTKEAAIAATVAKLKEVAE